MNRYTISSWFGRGLPCDFKAKSKLETLTCTSAFLDGVLMVLPGLEKCIKILNVDGKELDVKALCLSTDLGDVKIPGHWLLDSSIYEEAFRGEQFMMDEQAVWDMQEELHSNRQATVGQNGYDLFLDYNNYGTTHFRFTDADTLRGFCWGAHFFGFADRRNCRIEELYLNGQRIENIKAHVDALAEST